MAHIRIAAKPARKSRAEILFSRASKCEEKGNMRSAFRLYLAGAKSGDPGCQVNVGNLYDAGTGVRRNKAAALRWYKRAYHGGSASAASNIGVLWRNEGKAKRALDWFRKAARLGDDEANLEIAQHYLRNERNPVKAIPHLENVCKSNRVTQAGAERAFRILNKIRKQSKHTPAAVKLHPRNS
jgi:TPR repeat protein